MSECKCDVCTIEIEQDEFLSYDEEDLFWLVHHFLEDKWSLSKGTDEVDSFGTIANLLSVCPYLEWDGTLLSLRSDSEVSQEHQLIYYKRKYEDERDQYEKLYGEVKTITERF